MDIDISHLFPETAFSNYKVKPYPSFDGWELTLERKLDEIISDYLTSNYDQSTLFHGNIKSMVYTLAHYGHDPSKCAEQIRDDLSDMFSKYFKRAEVDTSAEKIDETGKYRIYIDITVSDGQGDKYQTREVINTDGMTWVKIAKVNNDSQFQSEQGYFYDENSSTY